MKIFLILLLSSVSMAASMTPQPSPPAAPPQPPPVRFQHVMDKDGRVMATLDTKYDTIDYTADPKAVVRRLIELSEGLLTECNKQLAAKNAPQAPSSMPTKKDEKPKAKDVAKKS